MELMCSSFAAALKSRLLKSPNETLRIMKLYNLINGCTALLVVALMTACSDKGGDSPDTGNTGTPDDDQDRCQGITTEVTTSYRHHRVYIVPR